MGLGILAAVVAGLYWLYRFMFGGGRKSSIFTAFPASSQDPFLTAWKRVAARHQTLNTYAESEAALRDVMNEFRSVLTAKDLIRTSGSNKLFVAHREGGALFEVGLGIRTTVQYNLFGGSVANLGSPEQVEWLQGVFDRGEIGCFALTEERAGVLSGLIVDTTATATASGEFVLSSAAQGSTKRWISNGLVARWAVVIARLVLKNGEDRGPHAFVCDLTLPGVKREDMPKKVAFNGLDNATIEFHNVRLPASALLSGISYLDADGKYCLRSPDRPFSFLAVAQRLLSGRICIAGAALSTIRVVVEGVEEYARTRMIPTGAKESVRLSQLPAFRDSLVRIRSRWQQLWEFLQVLEREFGRGELSDSLVDAIACAKIECIRFALNSFFELKMRVGSYSVQEDSPFGGAFEASLYCQRFAEGDAAILEQKMARDHIKDYAKAPWRIVSDVLLLPVRAVSSPAPLLSIVAGLAKARLALRMLFFGGRDKQRATTLWFESHELVTQVARLQSLLTIEKWLRRK